MARKTPNFGLSQFEENNIPSWGVEVNSDMLKIDTALKANADKVASFNPTKYLYEEPVIIPSEKQYITQQGTKDVTVSEISFKIFKEDTLNTTKLFKASGGLTIKNNNTKYQAFTNGGATNNGQYYFSLNVTTEAWDTNTYKNFKNYDRGLVALLANIAFDIDTGSYDIEDLIPFTYLNASGSSLELRGNNKTPDYAILEKKIKAVPKAVDYNGVVYPSYKKVILL